LDGYLTIQESTIENDKSLGSLQDTKTKMFVEDEKQNRSKNLLRRQPLGDHLVLVWELFRDPLWVFQLLFEGGGYVQFRELWRRIQAVNGHPLAIDFCNLWAIILAN